MTPLRQRMIDDMQLRGLSARTQEAYVTAVRQLAQHYRRSPDRITEEELRQYFLYLANEKKVARATATIMLCAVRFLYEQSLHRPWTTLRFVRPQREKKLPVVLSRDEVRTILAEVRIPVYRACLTTIYGCGLRLLEGTRLEVPDVDSARMVLFIHGKGKQDRYVPLSHSILRGVAPPLAHPPLAAMALPGRHASRDHLECCARCRPHHPLESSVGLPPRPGTYRHRQTRPRAHAAPCLCDPPSRDGRESPISRPRPSPPSSSSVASSLTSCPRDSPRSVTRDSSAPRNRHRLELARTLTSAEALSSKTPQPVSSDATALQSRPGTVLRDTAADRARCPRCKFGRLLLIEVIAPPSRIRGKPP